MYINNQQPLVLEETKLWLRCCSTVPHRRCGSKSNIQGPTGATGFQHPPPVATWCTSWDIRGTSKNEDPVGLLEPGLPASGGCEPGSPLWPGSLMGRCTKHPTPDRPPVDTRRARSSFRPRSLEGPAPEAGLRAAGVSISFWETLVPWDCLKKCDIAEFRTWGAFPSCLT